jgi:ABC-type nickel/cobalt efflux system permease component RcnA
MYVDSLGLLIGTTLTKILEATTKKRQQKRFFFTQTKEMIISQKQISTRLPSTNKQHAIDETHTQEKKHAKEEKKHQKRTKRNRISKAKKGTKNTPQVKRMFSP